MRCVRCGKPLFVATVEFRTAAGPAAYGPKCARIAGVLPPPRQRVMTVPLPRRRRADAAQLQLEFAR